MRDLGCLAQAVSRQKLRKLDLLGDEVLGTRRTKLRELYDGLVAGTIRTDREGARALYQSGPTDARWRQLKSRFRKKLLNTLLLVDVGGSDAPDYAAIQSEAQRELTQAFLLQAAGAHDAAGALAKTIFDRARERDLPDIVLASGQLLLRPHDDVGGLDPQVSLVDAVEARRGYQVAMRTAADTLSAIVEAEGLLLDVQSACARPTPATEPPSTNSTVLLRLGGRLDQILGANQHLRIRYAHAEAWVAIAQLRQQPDIVLQVVPPILAAAGADSSCVIGGRLASLREAAAIAFAASGNWPETRRLLSQGCELECGQPTVSSHTTGPLALLVRLALDCGETEAALDKCLAVVSAPGFSGLGARERELWWTRTAMAYALFPGAREVVLSLKVQRSLKALGTTQSGNRREQHADGWWAVLGGLAFSRARGEGDQSARVTELRARGLKQLDRRLHVRELALTQVIYRQERRGFVGGTDAVASRHLQSIFEIPESQVLAKAVPTPCRLQDLLPVFDVLPVRLAA